MLMEIAEVVANRGTCNRLHVGAVISRDGRILSMGYNGQAAGLPHCEHGPGEDPCVRAVHAEANSLAFAARHGTAVDQTDMHVTHSPCINCAKLIINSGIVNVYFRVPFRDTSGVELLGVAGVRCVKFNGGNDFEYWTGDGSK